MGICIERVVAVSGAEYVRVVRPARPDELPSYCARDYSPTRRPNLVADLAREGVAVHGKRDVDGLMDAYERAVLTADDRLVDGTGWQGSFFVLANGRYHAPDGERATIIADRQQRPPMKRHTKAWSSSLAEALRGQPALQFALCASLAPLIAPLVASVDNIVLEFVGGDDHGRALATCIANAAFSDSYNSIRTSTTSLSALLHPKHPAALRDDRLTVVDNVDLHFGNEKPCRCILHVKQLVSLLRARDPDLIAHARWILSGSQRSMLAPIEDLTLRRDLETTILTITPPDGSWLVHGGNGKKKARKAFAAVPKAVLADKGEIGRRFAQMLVDRRQADAPGLVAAIDSYRAKFFVSHRDTGAPQPVLESFALIFAAGGLAHEAGLLTGVRGQSIGTIICKWRRHAKPVFADILQAVADLPATMRLDGRTPPTPTQIAAAAAFTKKRGKKVELLIRPERIEELVPAWDTYRRLPECKNLMARDEDRRTVKRRIGPDGPERVLCFKLLPTT